ncbi:Rho GTPase activation protein [Hyaloscypha variabilis]
MSEMKSSVDGIRTVLSQLQLMLMGKSQVERNRTALILLEQTVIALSACVATFSDLDVFVESLGTDSKMGLLDRIRWASKTPTIQEHMQKLEMHKSTLTLMMTILTCASLRTAEDAVDVLSTTIQQVLASNILIAQRLASIEVGLGVTSQISAAQPPFTGFENIQPAPDNFQRNAQGFAFEEELSHSWVYKRTAVRNDDGEFSTISSAGRTASWSMLSGLSLADNISIVAVQALPVYETDLSNADLCTFGDFTGTEIGSGDVSQMNFDKEQGSEKGSVPIAEGSQIMTASTYNTAQANAGSLDATKAVFGVPLRQSIMYANVEINLTDVEGKSYVYGYVPIVVAKICVYIKQKEGIYEDIFACSGSAVRVHELERIFDVPPRYGKGFNWAGYSVYDAATCLLRYLKRLPEPVIPCCLYDRFTSILGPTVYENGRGYDHETVSIDNAVSTLQQCVEDLAPINRMLLLYLLDTAAVFASLSDTNKMTAARIVVAFQPSLLARETSVGMSVLDHARAADTLVLMIENRDQFLIKSREAAAKDTATTKADQATPTSEP